MIIGANDSTLSLFMDQGYGIKYNFIGQPVQDFTCSFDGALK